MARWIFPTWCMASDSLANLRASYLDFQVQVQGREMILILELLNNKQICHPTSHNKLFYLSLSGVFSADSDCSNSCSTCRTLALAERHLGLFYFIQSESSDRIENFLHWSRLKLYWRDRLQHLLLRTTCSVSPSLRFRRRTRPIREFNTWM